MRRLPWPAVRLGVTGLTLLVLPLATACEDGGPDPHGLNIVTSNTIIADLVKNVAGEELDVTSLVPAGSDPHTFDPSPSDARRVAEADIVFVNGLGLEEALLDLIEANAPSGAPLVALAQEIFDSGLEPPPGENGEDAPDGAALNGDPHMWLDPALARRYLDLIADGLSAVDPGNAADYARRADEYSGRIQRADRAAAGQLDDIPAGNRKLVTTHDAFAYYARHYGLQLVAVVVPGPTQEPTPRDVAEVTRALESAAVPAVFTEPQLGAVSRILAQAAEDAGVRVCNLYSDTLDDRVSGYLDLLSFNAEQLASCLGGGGDE